MNEITKDKIIANDVVDDDDGEKRYQEFLPRIGNANIDHKTLLATDYLNLFNEVIMLLEIAADMPEMLDECRHWKPKSYKQHFRDSNIADKDIIIQAYDYVRPSQKKLFEETIVQISFVVIKTLQNADNALKESNTDKFKDVIKSGVDTLKHFSSIADAIIHGSEKTMSQEEIDRAYTSLGVKKNA